MRVEDVTTWLSRIEIEMQERRKSVAQKIEWDPVMEEALYDAVEDALVARAVELNRQLERLLIEGRESEAMTLIDEFCQAETQRFPSPSWERLFDKFAEILKNKVERGDYLRR